MPELSKSADHRTRVGAERRQRMLALLTDATLKVMAEQGPENTTIDAIIQVADVSRGTFYKYYDAPASLVAAVGAELARDLLNVMAPALDQVDDPALRLTVAFRTTLQVARKNPLLAKFLVRVGWPVSDQVPEFTARAEANLKAGIELGRFRNVELAVAMALVGGLLVGILDALISPKHTPNLEEEATVTLLLALGIGEEEAKSLARRPIASPSFQSGGILARSLAL